MIFSFSKETWFLFSFYSKPFLVQRLVYQAGSLPTRIVCLTQVVSADELKDDEEYEGIMDDMRGECGKYGKDLFS